MSERLSREVPKNKSTILGKSLNSARVETSEVSSLFYYHAALLVGKKILTSVLDVYNGIFGISSGDRTQIYQRMSRHYMAKGLHVKAITCLKEWARMEPGSSRPLFEMAAAMVKTGKIRPAVNVYAKILSMDPGNVEALYAQTRLYFKLKDFDKALVENIPALKKAAPEDPEVLYLIAMVYSRTNRVDDAIEILLQAIQVDEGEIRYHQNLGFLYERAGNSEAAARCFSRVMELEDEEYEHQ